VGALQRRLDVDEGRRRQEQLDLGPSWDAVGAEAVPQLREQHAQGVPRLCGGVLTPAGHEQLLAGQRAASVGDEVGEQDPPSAAGQRVFDAGAVDVDDEATAQLDPGLGPPTHQVTLGQRSLSLP
jgi:hypothetical protein